MKLPIRYRGREATSQEVALIRRLIAANPDATLPVAGGLAPETGAVLAFLETAGGRTAEVVGKPNRFMFDWALEVLDLPANQVVMVGDTMATDIAGARAAGLRAVLVESGNPQAEDPALTPSLRLPAVADLIPHLNR